MKLVWLTDIHLNFLKKGARKKFYQDIINTHGDAVLLTGDIAEAPSLVTFMQEMSQAIKKPIYFVLGNHDYYHERIEVVKNAMQQLTLQDAMLTWLPCTGCQNLTENIILVGQDGWADGRYGDFYNSTCSMNCSKMIPDLIEARRLGQDKLLTKMQQLADADALQLKIKLQSAIVQQPKKIIILTHIPPFKEAAQHQGKMCNNSYLPFFCSKAVGDVLLPVVEQNSQIEFLVFCGHTHSPAVYQPYTNLTVKAGSSQYYKPKVQEIMVL